jgi:hypothetical protein
MPSLALSIPFVEAPDPAGVRTLGAKHAVDERPQIEFLADEGPLSTRIAFA